MIKKLIDLAGLAASAMVLPGCISTTRHYHYEPVAVPTTCEHVHVHSTVWCDVCRAGYGEGERIYCRPCWLAKYRGGPRCILHCD